MLQVGCRLPWNQRNQNDTNVDCKTKQQFRWNIYIYHMHRSDFSERSKNSTWRSPTGPCPKLWRKLAVRDLVVTTSISSSTWTRRSPTTKLSQRTRCPFASGRCLRTLKLRKRCWFFLFSPSWRSLGELSGFFSDSLSWLSGMGSWGSCQCWWELRNLLNEKWIFSAFNFAKHKYMLFCSFISLRYI